MSYIVISSFENLETGDLQAQGDAIAVFPSELLARARFANRVAVLAAAADAARKSDGAATFITWVLILQLPLDVASEEEALEDLELVLEETDSVDDPFGELVVAYEGHRHEPTSIADYSQAEALQGLEAWLS